MNTYILETKYITFYNEYKNPDHDYNIISCTLFRMKDGYKNEYKYYDGLKIFVDNFQKIFPDFYFRLYYDDSVLDYETPKKINNTKKLWTPLFDKMKKNKKIQLVKYEMKDFKIDKLHHNGVIGTMTRFYPMFDIPENKNIKCVIIADIDVTNYVLQMLKLNYNKMIKAKVDFFYLTRNCYELQDRFQILTKIFNIKFPILAGTILSKIKFPLNLIDDFFYCVVNNTDNKCDYYKIFNTLEMSNIYKRKEKINEIKYGIDELFTLLLKKYLYKNKIKHMISFDSDVAKPFYLIYKNYMEKKVSLEQFTNFTKYILLDIYDDKKSAEDNYKLIDNIVFFKNHSNNANKINKFTLFNRFLDIITKIKKNELNNIDFGFTDQQMDCVLNTVLEKKFYIIEYTNKFDDDIIKIDISHDNIH